MCSVVFRQVECEGLILAGLMCIGKYGEDSSDDFKVRRKAQVNRIESTRRRKIATAWLAVANHVARHKCGCLRLDLQRDVRVSYVCRAICCLCPICSGQTLITCRDSAVELTGIDAASLGLSMGMSHDFEQAIEFGAGYIRPGSTIFGARTYSNAGKK